MGTEPSALAIRRANAVAYEMNETMLEHGYLVDRATALHESFTQSRRMASDAARALLVHGARRGSTLGHMTPQPTAGGGLDLHSYDGDVQRTFRVKIAEKSGDSYTFVCGAGSSLLNPLLEGLWPVERWILGVTLAGDCTIEEAVLAEIVGHEGEGPVRLLLGRIIPLDFTTPPVGFTSSDDDDLPGFDDGDEEGLEGDVG